MAIFRESGLRALEQILLRLILHSHRQKLWEPRHSRPLVETAARHRPIIAALRQGGEPLASALAQHIDSIVEIAPGKDRLVTPLVDPAMQAILDKLAQAPAVDL